MTSTHSVTIELKGHLIDSLTLAKVIDIIQSEVDTSYKMDFIDVGYEKNDFSVARLRVTTTDETHMAVVLEKLKTYGAIPFTENDSHLAPCPADATPPENALFMEHIHDRVMVNGEWLALKKTSEKNHVLTVSQESQIAEMTYVDSLKKGDLVVVMVNQPSTAAYNLLK